MAVTKIHPIKSTLKKALDYIENPDKTDEKLFVSSYGCSYETADIEFQMLLDQAYQKRKKLPTVLNSRVIGQMRKIKQFLTLWTLLKHFLQNIRF